MSKGLSKIASSADRLRSISRAEGSSLISAVLIALMVTVLSGCELIGDLLKLGFWTGVIIVVIIVVLIMAVMRFFRRRL